MRYWIPFWIRERIAYRCQRFADWLCKREMDEMIKKMWEVGP